MHLTDRRTDRQLSRDYTALHSMQRGKNVTTFSCKLANKKQLLSD